MNPWTLAQVSVENVKNNSFAGYLKHVTYYYVKIIPVNIVVTSNLRYKSIWMKWHLLYDRILSELFSSNDIIAFDNSLAPQNVRESLSL